MLTHVGLNVPDLVAAKRYYDELMPSVGFEPFIAGEGQFSYRPAGGKPGTLIFFYLSQEPADYSRHRTGLQHVAFMVKTRPAVDEATAKAFSLGSEVIHPPRMWPEYHQHYYASFWYDPHGFMLEAVCHYPPSEGD